MGIVQEQRSGPDVGIVRHGGPLHRRIGMDPDPIAGVIVRLEDHPGADAAIIAQDIALADNGIVTRLKEIADGDTGIQDRKGADGGPTADHQRQLAGGLAARRVAEDARAIDDAPFPDMDIREDLDGAGELHKLDAGKP